MDVPGAVAAAHRQEWPGLVAALTRWCGDLGRAEDAAADALEAALDAWPRDGVPDRPGAWLHTVARRRLLDRVRRDQVGTAKLTALARDPSEHVAHVTDHDDPFSAVAWSDAAAEDLLRLVFTCCHPALSISAQVPLALRMICGLAPAEVSRLLRVPEATVQKRLARAKAKIRQTGLAFTVPDRAAWPDRLPAVLAVAGLLFTEGHAATTGDALLRHALCDEALRLAALLHRLLPDEPEVLGLRALLLLTDARRAARVDATGRLVLLADQDRARWRWADVDRGLALLTAALPRAGDRPGPWLLQACLAAQHAHPDPDPAVAVALYDRLAAVLPSDTVLAHRAAAVALASGPELGLAALDAVPGTDPAGHRGAALRAELLAALGRTAEADAAYARAVAGAGNAVEVAHLVERRRALGDRPA